MIKTKTKGGNSLYIRRDADSLRSDDFLKLADRLVWIVIEMFSAFLDKTGIAEVKTSTQGRTLMLTADNSAESVHLTRYIRFDALPKIAVTHKYFYFAPKDQDQCNSRLVLRDAINLYDKLEVKYIDLVAGAQVGGYVWAKYGFTPIEEAVSRLSEFLLRRLLALKPYIVPAYYYRAHELIGQMANDPKVIWDISDLSMPVATDGKDQMKLGKRLLLGSYWEGEAFLSSDEVRGRWHSYLNYLDNKVAVKAE